MTPALLIVAAVFVATLSPVSAPKPASEAHPDPAFVLDHAANRIDGTREHLAETYAGKVLLLVNVASRCGLTPQYAGLEALYRDHEKAGLVVMGFPANDFGKQEPGTNSQILEFCTGEYGVTFPMFEKLSVVSGDEQHPLYRDLTTQPEPIGGDPRWNFTKFLVGRDGKVVARFGPRDTPTSEKVVAAIEAELAKPVPAEG